MWIRDKLPDDIPAMKQIIYGYDTPLTGNESFQAVEDLALSLIAKLRSIGRGSKAAKPLIFFAHSLGGIILKQEMVILAGSSSIEKLILQKIRSVFFFGVLHLGMEMSHLLAIVQGQANEPLVRALSRDGGYLTLLDNQFRGIARFPKIRIISAYETKMSRATQVNNAVPMTCVPLMLFNSRYPPKEQLPEQGNHMLLSIPSLPCIEALKVDFQSTKITPTSSNSQKTIQTTIALLPISTKLLVHTLSRRYLTLGKSM
jgi:hypothetical protein